jgi:macrolide transport system ATP-binding/permease protein
MFLKINILKFFFRRVIEIADDSFWSGFCLDTPNHLWVLSGHLVILGLDYCCAAHEVRVMSLFRRISNLFTRSRVDREIDAELKSHLEMRTEDNIAAGMSPQEARRDALIRFGNPTITKERVTGMDTALMLDSIGFDIRYAFRQLWENPGFACTAILVLALGIGASVAIFAFVDAALIKPLPYRSPGRLVGVFETAKLCPRCNVSYLNFRDWKRRDLPFSSLEAWGYSTFLLRTPDGAQPASGTRITDGFFRTLGVTPVLGRDFYVGEDAPGKPRTVLLSYAAWQRRFGGSRNVIGQAIILSDNSYTIVGVLPQEFQFAPRGSSEFWTPLNDPSSCETRRSCHNLFGLARLKDGMSAKSALVAMQAIAQQLEKQYPEDRGYGADVVALSEVVTGNIRPILLVLLGGAGLLLLIACMNVSSLLVVRSESRKRETAVRGALGASPARLIRQFVTEGLVLVAGGIVLGLASAYLSIQLLLKLIPAEMLLGMPYLQQLGLNARVLAFAGAISLLAAALFSITPALRLTGGDLRGGLSEGGRTSSGAVWRRLGSRLVILELATAVILLVGAGLLGKSLYRLLNVDTGMQPDHLATIVVTMPGSYAEDKQVMGLERQLVNRVGSLPGVKSVGITTSLPSSSWSLATNILVAGRPWNGEHNTVPERDVSSDYLRTLGARLLRGRYFSEVEDDPSKPHVAIINETFAKQYFPGEDPIGKHLLYEGSKDPSEIVGIVADVKEGALDTANLATLYDPFSSFWFRSFNLIVRTSQAEQTLLPTLTATIHQIDPDIATSEAATMNDVIRDSQTAYMHRSSAWLVGGFAGLALLLSVVGLYGVIAYSVSQRTREIGVRMALGAERSSVYRLILKEAGVLIAAGVVAGLVCSVAAAALMRNLLFGTQAWDAPTLAAVTVVLVVCAMLASYIPARRAASVNPVEALRAE